MRLRAIAPTALFFLTTAASPYVMAQTGSVEVQTTIPFEFLVGKKLYPVGTYTVIRNSNDTLNLQLNQSDGTHLVSLQVLTRLARRPTVYPTRASLVFDVIDKQYYLSEVWMPNVDGYQVSTTTEIHKHAFVEVKE